MKTLITEHEIAELTENIENPETLLIMKEQAI